MHRRFVSGAAAALLMAAAAAPVDAQVPSTPRALGMGGAYIGAARGYEALFLNPANLALQDNPRWSISFPQVTASGTLLGAGFGDLSDLYTAYDDGESAEEILARIPEGGTEARYHLRAPLATLQIGRVALGVNYGSIGEHTLGKDVIELIVEGYETGRVDYSVGNTAGSRLTYWDVALGYAQRIGPVSVGVTGHYLRPGTAMRSRMYEPRIDLDNADIELNYVSVRARGGSGYAVDFGAAVQPTRTLTVSGSVTSAASQLDWSEELYVRDFVMTRAMLDTMWVLNIAKKYSATEEAMEVGTASVRAVETAEGLYDDASLPAIAQVGANWQPSARTDLGVAYREQLTEGRLGGRWEREASVGIQQRLPLVTVRGGYATNFDEGRLLSAGVSLGPMELGVAHLKDGTHHGAARNGWMATFGLGVMAP